MKELFRERDFTVVGYYQTVLESEGIQTLVRNQDLAATEVSIPDFFPALCVVNDEDYDRAREIIQEHVTAEPVTPGTDWKCVCGEENPASFEVCWSCGKARENR